jgi:hypothetical protein
MVRLHDDADCAAAYTSQSLESLTRATFGKNGGLIR